MTVPSTDLPTPPAGGGSLSAGDDYLRSLSTSLAGQLTPAVQGTIGSRPAAGKLGRTYYATDLGVVYFDTSASWVALNEAIGTVTYWGGIGAPAGGTHVEANGQEISRTGYPLYNSIISTRFGAGNGSTTVNVPNAGGRVLVGRDPSATVIPNSSRAVGQTSGEERHVLTPTEGALRDHTHPASAGGWVTVDATSAIPDAAALHGNGGDSLTGNFPVFSTQGVDGGALNGAAHNNMQPYLVLTPIVRVA